MTTQLIAAREQGVEWNPVTSQWIQGRDTGEGSMSEVEWNPVIGRWIQPRDSGPGSMRVIGE